MNSPDPIIAISFSHKDIAQACRLIRWIGWLSVQDKCSMLNHEILVVPSRTISNRSLLRSILWTAAATFKSCYCFIPDSESEVGWPGSPNFMFAETLKHAACYFPGRDLFWLEPDAIPVRDDWWRRICQEWGRAKMLGRHFMGNRVPHSWPHMTGNAVYGAEWPTRAPSLATAPNNCAWDCWSSKEVLPQIHATDLIQHVFNRPVIRSTKIVAPNTAVFHQDKKGVLIRLLDLELYSGNCSASPLFSYLVADDVQITAMKFYHAENANRTIRSHGMNFNFDRYGLFGGSWLGVYATESEDEQMALDAISSDPTSAVTVITQAEYEGFAKKKINQRPLQPSPTSQGPSLRGAIHQSPAAVVADPLPSQDIDRPGGNLPSKIDDVLKIADVHQEFDVREDAPPPVRKSRRRA